MTRFAGGPQIKGVAAFMSSSPDYDALGQRGIVEDARTEANDLVNSAKLEYYKDRADTDLALAEMGIDDRKAQQRDSQTSWLVGTGLSAAGTLAGGAFKGGKLFGGSSPSSIDYSNIPDKYSINLPGAEVSPFKLY